MSHTLNTNEFIMNLLLIFTCHLSLRNVFLIILNVLCIHNTNTILHHINYPVKINIIISFVL